MLLSKLFNQVNVHQLLKINLNNTQKSFGSITRQLSAKEKLSLKHNNVIKTFNLNNSTKYNEALQKCPKKEQTNNCKNDLPNTCKTETASCIFKNTYVDIKRTALDIEIFTRNSVNALKDFSNVASKKRLEIEKNRIVQAFKVIESKLDEVTSMSLVRGAKTRNKIFDISKRIHSKLNTWECENAAGIDLIKCRLESVECKVKERTDAAVKNVRTCKGCTSTENLEFCIFKTVDDSLCILMKTKEFVKKELIMIENLSNQFNRENIEILRNIMQSFEEEISQISKEMNNYIKQLKE